jgi:hypothetical protein
MDKNSIIALLTGLVMLIVAGSVFAITGSRASALDAATASAKGFSFSAMLFPVIRTTGGWVPYLLWALGPLADVYYQTFRYTLLAVVSIVAMVVGLLFQLILHGGGGIVPALTVGTTAALVYLIQDAWVQPVGMNNAIGVTVGSVIGIILTALVSTAGMLKSPLMDAGAAILLGAGIGELSWVMTYNTVPGLLPLANVGSASDRA